MIANLSGGDEGRWVWVAELPLWMGGRTMCLSPLFIHCSYCLLHLFNECLRAASFNRCPWWGPGHPQSLSDPDFWLCLPLSGPWYTAKTSWATLDKKLETMRTIQKHRPFALQHGSWQHNKILPSTTYPPQPPTMQGELSTEQEDKLYLPTSCPVGSCSFQGSPSGVWNELP